MAMFYLNTMDTVRMAERKLPGKPWQRLENGTFAAFWRLEGLEGTSLLTPEGECGKGSRWLLIVAEPKTEPKLFVYSANPFCTDGWGKKLGLNPDFLRPDDVLTLEDVKAMRQLVEEP